MAIVKSARAALKTLVLNAASYGVAINDDDLRAVIEGTRTPQVLAVVTTEKGNPSEGKFIAYTADDLTSAQKGIEKLYSFPYGPVTTLNKFLGCYFGFAYTLSTESLHELVAALEEEGVIFTQK